MVEIRIH